MNRRRHRQVTRKLATYATAAAASFLAKESSAEIQYTSFGATGIEIRGLFDINFDGQGNYDFRFLNNQRLVSYCIPETPPYDICATYSDQQLRAVGFSGNRMVRWPSGRLRALAKGARITHELLGASAGTLAAAYRFDVRGGPYKYGYFGEFVDKRAYLGLIFPLSDGPHVGWAEVGTTFTFGDRIATFESRIYGYAIQSKPRASIRAGAVPEPPSLVLLAAGALGLAVLRRSRGATVRA